MGRFFAGVAACFLMMTGAFLLWQSRAAEPAAPAARLASADEVDAGQSASPLLASAPEIFPPRRKAFAKLDKNGIGSLSFDEWAVKTLDKFNGANGDHSGWLSAAEYATTALPPPKEQLRLRMIVGGRAGDGSLRVERSIELSKPDLHQPGGPRPRQ